MIKRLPITRTRAAQSKKLRLGFVPLTDCAPLVMAKELGLYQKFGLEVGLSRELGWATIRDKIVHRELDVAHALAAMPVAATLGLGSIPCPCVTALVLNLNGNAITLSNNLWQRGIRDGRALREEIVRRRREKTFTFGVVFPFSSHRQLLRRWFAAQGIDSERDVHIVVVPPPQMVANLKAGHLDGFCAGDPWNSTAARLGIGWLAALSSELDPFHPEKVLMVREDFAVNRHEEHVRLVAALLAACEFCDQPENHHQVAETLARPEYVGVPAADLRRGLGGALDCGHGRRQAVGDFCVFHRHAANEPSGEKTGWALDMVRNSGLCPQPALIHFALGRKIFRPDIFAEAVRLRHHHLIPELYESKSQLALA